jgi:hypothetical protein
MPNYNANVAPRILALGNPQSLLFNNETVAAGEVSERVTLPQSPDRPLRGISFELSCDSDPGVFQIDVQEADTDSTAFYISIQSLAANNGAPSYVARFDLPLPAGSFFRYKVVTWPNAAVKLTAKMTGY